MYNYTKILRALIMLAGLFFGSLNAQVTGSADVSRIVSYQGQITTTDGISMNGTHHITATLYSDHLGKNSVWQGSYDVAIANGIFTLMLGTGASKLPDNNTMNRPLWVGISVDGSDEMSPLTELSSVPYALNIPDKSVTQAKLSPDVQSAIFRSGRNPTTQNANSAVYWSETGNNSTTAGTNYVGTSDNVALEVHVYDGDAVNKGSKRVLRWDPNGTSANITGGYQGNSINASAVGSVISGGGNNGNINQIANVNYCGISSGNNNIINSTCAYGAIGGGNTNLIQTGGISGAGQFCTIPGGDHLTAQSYAQTILGHYDAAKGSSVAGGTINGGDPLLLIGNGTAITASNAFEVKEKGVSAVYYKNGTGAINASIRGGTFTDNVIYGWGYYHPNSNTAGDTAILRDFGVSSVTRIGGVGSGVFRVILNIVDQNGTPTYLDYPAPVVTLSLPNSCVRADGFNAGANGATSCDCRFVMIGGVMVNQNNQTQFDIHIDEHILALNVLNNNYFLTCQPADNDFSFIVTGRPH